MHDSGSKADPAGAAGPEQVPAVEANGPGHLATEAEVTPAVYAISSPEGPLCCCEILSEVLQRRQSLGSLREAEPEIEIIGHPLCIVVSQDCDLEQDFRTREKGGRPQLPSILLSEVLPADQLKGTVAPGSDIWKRIVQNKDERYQFLRAVINTQDALNQGLAELGIDFRRYFTVPTDELYEQLSLGARRRCRLQSPYKEHLMVRLANFIARVGLPLDHHVEQQRLL